jgi:hypothetical protein
MEIKQQTQSLSGSLHSHGCWTDYRNSGEQKNFQFNLENFVNYCMNCGRDFQAITDIMAAWSCQPEFKENRYSALLATAHSKKDYDLEVRKGEAVIYFKSGRIFYIPRTQEVLTSIHFKHILALGLSENIQGGRSALDTLKQIKDLGGYAIIDHPFMCDAWNEEEIFRAFQENLILALEWNGGLTFSSSLPKFLRKRTPNKSSNERVLLFGERSKIPVVANDDSHCSEDIKLGAFTNYSVNTYEKPIIERIVDAIRKGNFKRTERYSNFYSPLKHVFYGCLSRRTFEDKGLPSA